MFVFCSSLNKRFARKYSTQITDEYILSVKNSLPKSQITQESMLLKLDQLVPLKDSFAVVQVGGHQVLQFIFFFFRLIFAIIEILFKSRCQRISLACSIVTYFVFLSNV